MANDVNVKINVDASQAQKQTTDFRAQIRELTRQMTELQLAGKVNTEEYRKLAAQLGVIKDAMGDTAAQARILSNDYFKQQAAIEGLAVGVNIFSGLAQAAALCGVENEDLQKTLVKLQAAQNLANTAMNISKALNKDTALMTALRTRYNEALNTSMKEQVITEEAAAVTTKTLNTVETTATATTKGLSLSVKSLSAALKAVPLVGWITAGVTALIALKSKLDSVREEQRKSYEETQKQYTEAQNKINKSVADTTVKFDRLRYEYEKLGDTVEEKNKFIKEHQGAFNDLGLSIKSVEDAEDAFVKNKTKFIDALMAKAQAAAAFDTATEKFVKIFENKKIIEENTKLAESLKTVWESQGVSQAEIEKALKTYTNANAELQDEINATMSEIESLYELMVDDEPVKDTGNTIKQVTAIVEDFDAEMEQAMKGVDWRTEKEKSDEFWNSLLFNMDEYQQKGEEIDRESLAWAEQQDAEYKRALQREKDIREAKLKTLETIGQGAAVASDFITALMESELQEVEGNAKKEQQVRKKYAGLQFALQIGSIATSTAKAIMETWAAYGEIPFVGPALAGAQTAVILGLAATQTVQANTARRKALSGKAARGAFITGKSHAEGGELWELEGGEAVMNKKAMEIPSFRALASAMNEATGGISFTNNLSSTSNKQGLFTATVDKDTIRDIVVETVSGIVSIPVTVCESAITTAQRNVHVINSRASF